MFAWLIKLTSILAVLLIHTYYFYYYYMLIDHYHINIIVCVLQLRAVIMHNLLN